MGLSKGSQKNLASKIDSALQSFDTGDITATLDNLDSFVAQVNKAKKLSADQTQILLDGANKLSVIVSGLDITRGGFDFESEPFEQDLDISTGAAPEISAPQSTDQMVAVGVMVAVIAVVVAVSMWSMSRQPMKH